MGLFFCINYRHKSGMKNNKNSATKGKREATIPAAYRLQGIACALGELAGAHMEPDLAAMVLHSLDITVDDLEKAGADAFDLDRLRH